MKHLHTLLALILIALSAHSQGTLDPEFGSGGASVFLNSPFETHVWDMTIDGSSRIVLCGDNFINSDWSSGFLIRMDNTGAFDPSFGENGVARFATEDIQSAGFNGVRILPNGHYIVLGGRQIANNLIEIFFTELDQSGNLIAELNGGAPSATISANLYILQFTRTPQGKLVVVYLLNPYQSSYPLAADIYVRQFNNDGTPDVSFGNNGLLVLGTESMDERVYDMDVSDEGTIYLSGYRRSASDQGAFAEALIVAIDAQGNPVAGFGNNGFASVASANANISAQCVTVLPDQSIAFGGFRYSPSEFVQNGFLAKLNPNGTHNYSFGDDGFVFSSGYANGEYKDIVALSDGHLVATGKFSGGGQNVMTTSVTADGQFSENFGTNGQAEAWGFPGGEATPIRIAQNGSNLVVCGRGVNFPSGGESILDSDDARSGQLSEYVSFVIQYLNTVTSDVREYRTSEPSIFPNPASDWFTITSSSRSPLSITDAAGRMVMQFPLMQAGSNRIPVHGLPSGMYLVHQAGHTVRVIIH